MSPIKWTFWDFQGLGQDSPNSLCHFSKHKSVPLQILHHSSFSVITHNTSVVFWLKHNILLAKVVHQSTTFWTLPLLALKFTSVLMSFLEPRVSFYLNFASLFHVMRHNSSVLFRSKLYMLWTNGAHRSVNFQTFDCSHEN